MAKVELYIKTTCPYCTQARQLLARKGVETEEYVVDAGGPKKEEMIQRANGRTTVPQIFIDGRHVGGCSDLTRLDQSGELDKLLAA